MLDSDSSRISKLNFTKYMKIENKLTYNNSSQQKHSTHVFKTCINV